jgi:hypothetical protein
MSVRRVDPDHRAAGLSVTNLKRIAATPEGGGRDAWPRFALARLPQEVRWPHRRLRQVGLGSARVRPYDTLHQLLERKVRTSGSEPRNQHPRSRLPADIPAEIQVRGQPRIQGPAGRQRGSSAHGKGYRQGLPRSRSRGRFPTILCSGVLKRAELTARNWRRSSAGAAVMHRPAEQVENRKAPQFGIPALC